MVYVVCMIVIHYDWPDIDPPTLGFTPPHRTGQIKVICFLAHFEKKSSKSRIFSRIVALPPHCSLPLDPFFGKIHIGFGQRGSRAWFGCELTHGWQKECVRLHA